MAFSDIESPTRTKLDAETVFGAGTGRQGGLREDLLGGRNGALHELVKIEAGQPMLDWDQRMADLSFSAVDGYELLKRLYNRVAELNPRHGDRVFPYPTKPA